MQQGYPRAPGVTVTLLKRIPESLRLPGLFIFARLVLLVSLPLEGVRGYGDLHHYTWQGGMGIPYLDFWVEYPPLFPFINRLLYLASGGVEHVFETLLVLLFTLAQAGCLVWFVRLEQRLHPQETQHWRAWVYFSLLLVLPYGWRHFDALAVYCLLAGMGLYLEKRHLQAAFAIAAGVLFKLFPLFVLPAFAKLSWQRGEIRRFLLMTALVLLLCGAVYGLLFMVSPHYTAASLASQGSKGSWQTVWALWDGNLGTGSFPPTADRTDPASARQSAGNPPRLSPWISLGIFGLLGVLLLLRSNVHDGLGMVNFLTGAWLIFLLWSPGWSPQWLLFLLPLLLLALPLPVSILSSAALTAASVLEWPVLLSRGLNWGLWYTIPLRTGLFGLLAALIFWQLITRRSPPPGG